MWLYLYMYVYMYTPWIEYDFYGRSMTMYAYTDWFC